MTSKREIKTFEQTLIGVMGRITSYAEGRNDLLFNVGFPRYREEMERVRPGLEMLGMYDRVRDALQQAETLARQGRCAEAQDKVGDAVEALMKTSGTWEDMKRQYSAANEPKAKA